MSNWFRTFVAMVLGSLFYSRVSVGNERLSFYPRSHLEMGYRSLPWLRDPFYPRRFQFELTGLIVNEKAFIDGRWFSIGEHLDQYVLTKVMQDKVILKRGDETFSLKLVE